MPHVSATATVLFIDDDEDFAAALSLLLRQEGYHVRCAANGEEGVRIAEEERPDPILLDLMMPVKSGFTACQELRRKPALQDVPIIAITAFGRNIGEIYGVGGERVQVHVDDVVEKPVEPNVLLERVASALSRGLHG